MLFRSGGRAAEREAQVGGGCVVIPDLGGVRAVGAAVWAPAGRDTAAILATIRDTTTRATVMTRVREAIANLVSAFDYAFSEQRRAASTWATLIAREFSRAIR